MISRKTATVALATAGLIALPSAAFADNVKNDVVSETGVGNIERVATNTETTVNYYIQPTGGTCDAADASPLTLIITAPTAVTKSVSSLVFSSCGEANSKPVTFSSATAGNYSVTHTAKDEAGDYNVNPANFTLAVSAPAVVTPAPDADGDGVPDSDDTNSYAPAVGSQAGAANGNEGTVGNPATSGSFTDQDGNGTLTVTKVSGQGAVVDNRDGTFSWSHTTTDDASGSVTVKASDGEHTDATQTFTWTAANVAPVVTGVTQTRVNDCAVTLGATFTDAGSADTHTTSVLWEDGNTDLARTFTTAGTYHATVTVTDDDGGSGSNTVEGVRAYNTASAIAQPINSTGSRSGFKIGSTIPVKITVTGCDKAPVTTLTPQVSLVKSDSAPDVAVNEVVATDAATAGITMRWDGSQYHYNLSTKLSQFTNAALTQGTYTVSVSDPSFAAPVKAAFDLRK
ncbi:PxKF domain-containing protein [Blastococcus sp. SYSU DS0973]